VFGLFRKEPAKSVSAPTEKATVPATVPRAILESIVPIVKVMEFDGVGRELEIPEQDAPIAQDFVADLMILYAEDKPDRFEFVSARRLKELGMTREELHLRALLNLPARPPKIELHGAPPKQMLIAGGNFEATLLLHDDLWNKVSKDVPGELLAVAPARDLLFISNTSWEGAREFLAEMASRDLEDKSHRLSQRILRRSEGRWIADGLAS
jgi:uncharacterized protein YtpQ (UPF0354 family)